jgi:hypothetical protein
VVLNVLFDRYPSLRTIPDEPPEFLAAALLTGLRKLPLSLSGYKRLQPCDLAWPHLWRGDSNWPRL